MEEEKEKGARRFSLVKEFVIVPKDDFYQHYNILPARYRLDGLDLDRDGLCHVEKEVEKIM